MARKMTPQQVETFQDLACREGVAHVRQAWDGKTLLLGVGIRENPVTGVSSTRMYRIEPDGKARGV